MFDECVDMPINDDPDVALLWYDHLFPEKKSEAEAFLNPDLVSCPKADKCVMDCHHRKPHVYEEKYCNDTHGSCGIKCVHELISDVTFFEEDFRID